MNVYVDNVFIFQDDKNIPKENVPPALPLSYPKIYPMIVHELIIYSITSHFIIVFFDTVHAQESKKTTIPISTLKHSFSFATHFISFETVLMQCTGLVSYIIASIRLLHFGSHSRTVYFYVSLVSICALFDSNYSCVTYGRIPLTPFYVTP